MKKVISVVLAIIMLCSVTLNSEILFLKKLRKAKRITAVTKKPIPKIMTKKAINKERI